MRYFSACCLQIKHINSLLLPSLFSLVQILGGQTLIFLHAPAFLFQRGCSSLGASSDETYFNAEHLYKIPRSTGERCYVDRWGNGLLIPPKTKNNFSEIDISQPTP